MSFADFRRRASGAAHGGSLPPRVSVDREDERAPVVYRRVSGAASAAGWLRDNAPLVERALDEAGAVLLRDFAVDSPERLEAAVGALYGQPMSYRENTSPRTTLRGEIKTSTDHPADQAIELHSEQSYSRLFPLRLLLACQRPADEGGETPIADTRRILERIAPEIVARFARGGYIYRRAFLPGFRPDWRETYQSDDREELEHYLAWAGISWRWDKAEVLHTEIRRAVVTHHPRTGESAWFNHVLFWHHSSLEPELAGELLNQFGEEGLPYAVFHGDGSPISAGEIAEIRAAHRAETWALRWKAGDLLVIDNVLRAHGRAPYAGARAILFAMASPFDAAKQGVNWMV